MKLALKAFAAGIALTAAMAGSAAADCTAGSSATATFTVCTAGSGGHCIHRGDACPRTAWHKHGTDAAGHRLVCSGSHAHPHWRLP